jgi:hypothetical protein
MRGAYPELVHNGSSNPGLFGWPVGVVTADSGGNGIEASNDDEYRLQQVEVTTTDDRKRVARFAFGRRSSVNTIGANDE